MDSQYTLGTFLARSRETNRHSIVVSMAILYYDYMLTFPSEVHLFWSRPCRNLPSFFFFLSRYSALLLHIPIALEFFYPAFSYRQCRALLYFHRLYCFYAMAIVISLQTIRTYVFYDRSRKLLGGLICLGVLLSGMTCWAFVMSRRLSQPPPKSAWREAHVCVTPMTTEQGHFLAIAWSSAMIYDTVIFVLTYLKYRQVGQTMSNKVFGLMIRDGCIYYGLLVVLWSLVLYDLLANRGVAEMVTITNAISIALMSRLMLNLRELKNLREEFSNVTTFSWVTIAPNSMLSSFRSPCLSPIDDNQRIWVDRDVSDIT